MVQLLAGGQHDAGQSVCVSAILDAGSPEPTLVTELRARGVDVRPMRVPARAYALERTRLRGLVHDLNPDVVHTHGYREDLLAGSTARALGIPTVTTVHGFTGGGLKNRLYEWLQVRSFRRFAAVVAVSRPIRERLLAAGVPPARIEVVPNAAPARPPLLTRAEARRALGAGADDVLVGWVGRLGAEKGPDVMVEALTRISPPAVLVIIGTGREEERLHALAARSGLAARIRWLGAVPNAGLLFRAFDCFVLSSRTEGTPMVLFEAMAAEVPVVATGVGGVPDVVGAGQALLVPPGDPIALAAAVQAVLDDRGSAASRSARALRRLETERAVEPWVARYDAVYRGIVPSSIPES